MKIFEERKQDFFPFHFPLYTFLRIFAPAF